MSKDTNKSKPTKPARFSVGNILLTLGIVIVSILIALVLQAWYTTFIVQGLQTAEMAPTPPTTDSEKISSTEVSVSLEEKYKLLEAIDAANPTSTITTADKKRILQNLATGKEARALETESSGETP